MTGWSIPLDRFAEKAKLDLETVTRKATLEVFKSVVLKSPVGNPSLWKDPPPPGYVGGRFRANWNVSYGVPDFTTTASTDKSRGEAEAARALTLPVGGIVYIANGLPYGPRLEYDGWSSQAPQGMVRLSAIEFNDYVRQVIEK